MYIFFSKTLKTPPPPFFVINQQHIYIHHVTVSSLVSLLHHKHITMLHYFLITLYIDALSITLTLTRLRRHSETKLYRNHGNRRATCAARILHKVNHL